MYSLHMIQRRKGEGRGGGGGGAKGTACPGGLFAQNTRRVSAASEAFFKSVFIYRLVL